MTEQAMSPSEAAGVMESLRTLYDFASRDDQALSALIDHARATAAHGDLAALAEQWEGQATDLLREMGRSSVSVEEATANPLVADALNEAAADLRAALAAHRCAPTAEVATCACGHGKGEHIGYGDGGCSFLDGLGIAACACMSFAPAAPPAEGEAASGDPTGAIARMRDRIGAAVDSVWSPGDNDEDGERDRLLDAVMAVVGDLMRRHARTAVQDMRAARRRLDAARNELAALRGASGGAPS